MRVKPKLLLLFTNHRVAEKLYNSIPELNKYFELDIFCIGLFSNRTKWIGNSDERTTFFNQYGKFFNKIINGPGIRFHGDRIYENLIDYITLTEYSIVIYDDNRDKLEYSIPTLYRAFNDRGIKVLGNSHGNEEYSPNLGFNRVFDAMFTFGNKEKHILINKFNYNKDSILTGGIPTNDRLKDLKRNSKHILIITNFLGNRPNYFPVNFNEEFVKKSKLIELSNHFKLPIIVKQKARLDDPNYQANVNYIKNVLDCEVITSSTEDTEQVIADSAIVISSLSTLAFKPIQLQLPTVVIKGTGQLGNFYDYNGLVNLDSQEIFSYINNFKPDIKFIENTLTGGLKFNASEVYAKKVKEYYDISS